MHHRRPWKGSAQREPKAGFPRWVEFRVTPAEFEIACMGEIRDFRDDGFWHIGAREHDAAMPTIADNPNSLRAAACKGQRRRKKQRTKDGAALDHAGSSTPCTTCTTPLLAIRLGRMMLAEVPEGAWPGRAA